MSNPHTPTGELGQLVFHALSATSATTLYGLISGRVYASHSWQPDPGTVQHPLVTYALNGGATRYFARYQAEEMSLMAWSKVSSGEARQVYDAAFQLLHATRLAGTNFSQAGYAAEVVRPQDGYDAALGAWYVGGSWLVRLAG